VEKRSEVRIVAAGECIMQKHGVEALNSNRGALVFRLLLLLLILIIIILLFFLPSVGVPEGGKN